LKTTLLANGPSAFNTFVSQLTYLGILTRPSRSFFTYMLHSIGNCCVLVSINALILDRHYLHTIIEQTLPDLGAPTQACDTVGGTRFFCDVYQKVGFEQDFMDLNITIECYLDTTTGFDFRRASGCTCTTLLTPSNASRLPKTCPCYVCPMGFGSSSVSIDCSYLIPNATDTTNTTNATASSTVPSSVPSFSPTPGGAAAAATSAPAAVPTASSGSPTSMAPVVGGGQAIPIAPTLGPAGSGAPVASVGSVAPVAAVGTGAPSAAGSGAGAVPQMQRNRHLQGGSTGAPSTAAPLVNGTTDSANTTANVTVLPDPYIFDTCVSVDCGGNCNGTCSLGCDDPTASTLCDFCEGAAGSPTPVPSGSDGAGTGTGGGGTGNVPTIGSKSGAAAPTVGGIQTLVMLGWVAVGAAVIMTEGGGL
jgi:hypothetical protein